MSLLKPRATVLLPPSPKVESSVDKTHRSYTSLKSKAPPIKRDTDALKKGGNATMTIGIPCPDAASSSEIGGAVRLERIRALVKARAKDNTQRSDKPPEYNLIRGSKAVALQVASDIDALNAAERKRLDSSRRYVELLPYNMD